MEDARDVYAYHSGSHVSKKLDQSPPWEVPQHLVWSRTTNPFLTANRTQAAGNGAREVQAIHQIQCFFDLARVPGVPCRFMELRFREPLDSGTGSMKPLLEEALLSTLSWLLSG